MTGALVLEQEKVFISIFNTWNQQPDILIPNFLRALSYPELGQECCNIFGPGWLPMVFFNQYFINILLTYLRLTRIPPTLSFFFCSSVTIRVPPLYLGNQERYHGIMASKRPEKNLNEKIRKIVKNCERCQKNGLKWSKMVYIGENGQNGKRWSKL